MLRRTFVLMESEPAVNFRLQSAPLALAVLFALQASSAMGDNLTYQAGLDPKVGYNIWDPYKHTEDSQRLVNQVNAMKAAGMHEVSFLPFAYADMTTGQIKQDWAGDTFGSMTDAELTAGIQRAKQLGMKVTVTPLIQKRNSGSGRDEIVFTPSTAPGQTFWNDYKTNYTRWANVAQAAGADRLNIGSEMTGLDNNAANAVAWTDVINATDAAFTGQLGYTTQHWTFAEPAIKNMIWTNAKIDYISVSAYPTYQPEYNKPGLASTAQAAGQASDSQAFINTVRDNFTDFLDDTLLPLSTELNKPLIIGEFGVTPFDGASTIPYKWWYSVDPNDPNFIPYDPLEQKNVWEGVLRALDGQAAQIEAIHAWIWGWDGGFGGEQFYMRPGAADVLPSWFDESQSAPASSLISNFASGTLPEPGAMILLVGLGAAALRRRS
ncbi:MAG: hypothetical protein H7144_18310 [Burkholderiales bacterium]|nr:hypothetical protein [Phycisphaerae bacterium]